MDATIMPLRSLNTQQRKAIDYFYAPSTLSFFLSVFLPITISLSIVVIFTGLHWATVIGVSVALLLLLLRAWRAQRRIVRARFVYEYGEAQTLYYNGSEPNYSVKVNGAPQQVISLSYANTSFTIKTFDSKVIAVYTIDRQKAYAHPGYPGTLVPEGIFLLDVPPKRSLGRRLLNRLLLLLLPLGFIFGLAYTIYTVMESNSYTHSQPDALVYKQDGKLVLACVLTHFQANEVNDGHVYGSDDNYAAGIDLQTGRRLWKVNFHARNAQGNDAGGAQLLGQSDKYLFFLRNELYVVDKAEGKVVARNEDFPALKDKFIKSFTASYNSDADMKYIDSLQALVIRGADGLFYTINGNTLQTGAIDIPDPDKYFENKWKYGNNYRDWIAALHDDGQRCLTLLDAQDTVLLARNPIFFEMWPAGKSVRRRLYSCPSNNLQANWTALNQEVFLFGGFLVEKSRQRTQQADSLSNLRAFDALLHRYNAINPPMRTMDSGFIILHKQTITQRTTLLLTGITAAGKPRWQVNTGYTDLPFFYHDVANDVLYISGNTRQEGTGDDMDQVMQIGLKNGKSNAYKLE